MTGVSLDPDNEIPIRRRSPGKPALPNEATEQEIVRARRRENTEQEIMRTRQREYTEQEIMRARQQEYREHQLAAQEQMREQMRAERSQDTANRGKARGRRDEGPQPEKGTRKVNEVHPTLRHGASSPAPDQPRPSRRASYFVEQRRPQSGNGQSSSVQPKIVIEIGSKGNRETRYRSERASRYYKTSPIASPVISRENSPGSSYDGHAPEYPRTIVHNTVSESPSITQSTSRSGVPQISDRAIDRERRRKQKDEDEERRLDEAISQAAKSAAEEAIRDVRFHDMDTGRYEERDKLRQELIRRQMAEERKEKRKTEAEKVPPPTLGLAPSRSSRRRSLTQAELGEQIRLLRQEEEMMSLERAAAERRQREEAGRYEEKARLQREKPERQKTKPPAKFEPRPRSTSRRSITEAPVLTYLNTPVPGQQSYATRPPSLQIRDYDIPTRPTYSRRYSPSQSVNPFALPPQRSYSGTDSNPFAAPADPPLRSYSGMDSNPFAASVHPGIHQSHPPVPQIHGYPTANFSDSWDTRALEAPLPLDAFNRASQTPDDSRRDNNDSYPSVVVQMTEPAAAEEDNASTISSHASSVIPVRSVAPQGTGLSSVSGHTADEIATATRKLAQIFYRDDSQVLLYTFALRDPAIGPAKLERNLKLLFRSCAQDIKKEATARVDYLGARLITHQAKVLAKIIVSQLGESLHMALPNTGNMEREGSGIGKNKEESSDDEELAEIFGEIDFAHFLPQIITCLEVSGALQEFHVRLEKLVDPEFRRRRTGITATDSKPLDSQRALRSEPESRADTLQSELAQSDLKQTDTKGEEEIGTPSQTSHREEALSRSEKKQDISGSFPKASKPLPIVRRVILKWNCRCNHRFESVVIEVRENGIVDLVDRMQQSIGSKVTVTEAPNPTGPSQAKVLYQHLSSLLSNAFSKLALKFQKQNTGPLPHHNNDPAATTSSLATSNTSQQRMLHLLACMHTNRFRKSLAQDRVESITCDRKLFTFMRDRHSRGGGRTRLIPSLNEVRGIFFVKFRLPLGGNVEVRHHNPCCQPLTCECIPPKDRVEPSNQAEYRCIPGPPSVWPPVDPQYLAHLFNDPSCVNENDTWILDQLPRRICGELHGKAGQPAEGWGIYYQEGLNWRIITLTMVVVFILVSLFGVLWAYYKKDIQGAFGVSSYVFAACGIFLSLVAINSDRA